MIQDSIIYKNCYIWKNDNMYQIEGGKCYNKLKKAKREIRRMLLKRF